MKSNNENEIVTFMNKELKKIKMFKEHRLYTEEQIIFYDNKDAIKVRNCLEWIIRSNRILNFIKYSLDLSVKYINDKSSELYSYYIEDSIYRLIVLWDIYKQLVNEFYDLGFDRNEYYSIFKLKDKLFEKGIWRNKERIKFERYLNSDTHNYIRNELRNHFAHCNDPTIVTIFNDNSGQGLKKEDFNKIIPINPAECLVYITKDLNEVVRRINYVDNQIERLMNNKAILVNLYIELACGEVKLIETKDINEIKKMKKNNWYFAYGCDKRKCPSCKKYIVYKDMCKAKSVKYSRIHENRYFKL